LTFASENGTIRSNTRERRNIMEKRWDFWNNENWQLTDEEIEESICQQFSDWAFEEWVSKQCSEKE
jgi:hypothetical protein